MYVLITVENLTVCSFQGWFNVFYILSPDIIIVWFYFTIDREALQELDAKLKEERKHSGEMV